MRRDILYCEGPGDIVDAYAAWKGKADFLSATSTTFSGQVFEFCRLENLSLYALSYCATARAVTDGSWTVTNLPRWNIRIPKIGYELTVFLYALRLLMIALRVKPKTVFINSGVTDWAYLSLLRLSGAKLVPILHNTLWPEGFQPTGFRARVRQRAYRFLWRRVWLTLAVSPAAGRQVKTIAGDVSVTVFRPTFPASSFSDVTAKSFAGPFRVMFAGRIEENKGVFDILAMAARLPDIEFSLCGDGHALPEIQRQIESSGLRNVKTHGNLNRPALIARYLEAHVVIVPTRSTFTEGFAMVVAEAILLLRPVITNSVVPAAELLKEAVVLAKTDDVQSYVDVIEAIRSNASLYLRLVDCARALRPLILDDSTSFLAALQRLHRPAYP